VTVKIASTRMTKQGWLVAALIFALLAIAGVAGRVAADASAASGNVDFHKLTEGSRAAILPGERLRTSGRVLRSAAEGTRVLRQWGLDTSVTKAVDFGRESLIVVLAQYQPTGGYRARVSRVVVHGRTAVVTAAVSDESGDDFVTQALTRPWVVVAVKRGAVANVSSEVQVRLAGHR
jgi:hypothetical protein